MPPIELIERRTRNSKTHSLGGRKYSWDGTIGSVHYEDNGWQEIDNIFELAIAPWDWQMLKAGYHIRVKEDFTDGQVIGFFKGGESTYFQPMALEWTNDLDQIQQISMPTDVSPVITNPEVDLLSTVGMPSHQGTIRWNDAYGQGIDFEWKCTPTRLLKILEIENLNNLPVPEQYILDGGNPVLRLNLLFDPSKDVDIYVDGELWNRKVKKLTFGAIEFRKDGEVLWGFMPLRYWDSSEDDRGQSVATLEKRGNKLYISIRIPYSWLQSATYPVFIDADVEEQVGADSDDADNAGIGGDFLQVGWGANHKNPGFRFTTVDVPGGADNIIAAHVEFMSYSTSGDISKSDIGADDVDNSVTFAADNLPSSRTITTAKVLWTITAWNDDTWYASDVEIKTVIQEIVARGGWSANNAISILLRDNGSPLFDLNKISAREFATAEAAKLHIEYTEVGGEVVEGSASGSGIGLASSSAKLDVLASTLGNGIGLSTSTSLLTIIGQGQGNGVGLSQTTSYLIIPASAIASGLGISSTIGITVKLGIAAGSGIGTSTAQALVRVLASASGNGIGLASATGEIVIFLVTGTGAGSGVGTATAQGILDVIANASGSGIGQATVQAILDILAEAGGSGVGLGSTEALIRVLAAAAASGEGLGSAEALLEVIAQATGEGIGTGQGQSYIIIFGSGQGSGIGLGVGTGITVKFGQALGSGIGSGTADALLKVLAEASGSGVGLGVVEGLILIVIVSSETGIGIERATRAGWLMKPVVYTSNAFDMKTYTGE